MCFPHIRSKHHDEPEHECFSLPLATPQKKATIF